MLSGSMVAVVTPMDADGKINYRQFAKLIDFHVESGSGLLISERIAFGEHGIERHVANRTPRLRERLTEHPHRPSAGPFAPREHREQERDAVLRRS